MLRVLPVAKIWYRLLGTMKKYLLDYSDMPKISTENPYPWLELWIGKPIERIHWLFHHCSFSGVLSFCLFAWVTQRNILPWSCWLHKTPIFDTICQGKAWHLLRSGMLWTSTFPLKLPALTLCRLNLWDGVHIGYALKVILYPTTL